MAANTAPIFPAIPIFGVADLTAVSACATRAPVATANLSSNNLVQLVASQTNGFRLDEIQIKAASSSITAATAAQLVQIWAYDGTKAWLIDEIVVTAQTPSTTSPSFATFKTYSNRVFPAGVSLYASTTVTTTASTTALIAEAFAGAY